MENHPHTYFHSSEKKKTKMPADVSAITYFAPIAAFLIVFIVIYAVLLKTKLLGDNKWIALFFALFVASIFISLAGARQYVQTIVPLFAILIVSLVFLLILIGIIGKPTESFHKGIGLAAVIIFTLVFLITGFILFSHLIVGYLPWSTFGYNTNPNALPAFEWLYSSRVAGAILLIIISAAVSWILVKTK